MAKTDVSTGKVRLSFVHVFKPHAVEAGQEEKYSTVVLLPKHDVKTKAAIDAAIEAAKAVGVEKCWHGSMPPKVLNPIKDGDGVKENGEPFGEECKGHWVFTASAKVEYKPEVIGRNMKPITDQSEIYSGVYARLFLNFYPYSYAGKKGVGCGLGPVQKIEDGTPLGGGVVKASSVFSAVDIDPLTGEAIL